MLPTLRERRTSAEPRAARLTSPLTVARNSFLSLASEVWTLLVLFVAMPIVIRVLGPDAFGLFSLAWVVLGYMAILDFGVSRAATKFVSEHLSREDLGSVERVCRTAITSNLVLGVAGGAAVLVLTPWLAGRIFHLAGGLQSEARGVFVALALSVPILLMQSVIRSILASYQKFGWISGLNSAAITLQWGGACVLALLGFRVGPIVIACVIMRAATTVGYAIVLSRIDRQFVGLDFSDFDELWRLLRFGGWVTISQLMTPVLLYLDRILVASLISLTAMTMYVIPYEVITRLRIVPASLVNSLFPSLSERSATPSKDSLVWLYNESLKYLLLLLLPCFLVLAFLGSDIIAVWVGPEYAANGGQVLRIMAGGALLNSLSYVPYAALLALGRPDWPAKFHLAELPLYVGLSFLLIPHWGIVGAAWAVTIRLAGDAVALFWAAGRQLNQVAGLRGIPRPIMLNAVLAFALVAISHWTASIPLRLFGGGVSAVGYSIAAWFFILEKRERPLLLQALQLRGRAA